MRVESTATAPLGDETVQGLIRQRATAALSMPADLPSPCISLCQMNSGNGLCHGCLRTIEEICAWSSLNDSGKRAVWRKIEQRCAIA